MTDPQEKTAPGLAFEVRVSGHGTVTPPPPEAPKEADD